MIPLVSLVILASGVLSVVLWYLAPTVKVIERRGVNHRFTVDGRLAIGYLIRRTGRVVGHTYPAGQPLTWRERRAAARAIRRYELACNHAGHEQKRRKRP